MKTDVPTLGRLAVVSCAVAVPCLWRPFVSPADMQSHLYNAWLVNLVEDGKAPGLFLTRQSTNVLVDVALSWLLRWFGAGAAERLTDAAAVLLFFWGAFFFLTRTQNKPVWWLTPWLAILSYGMVFQAGFINYYASTGLVLWALGLTWNGRYAGLIGSLPLLALAWLGHPVPVLWFVAVVGYGFVASRLPVSRQWLLCGAAISALLLLRGYLMTHFSCGWSIHQIALIFGADQADLYGKQYLVVSLAIMGLIALLGIQWLPRWRKLPMLNVQLYALIAGAIVILPTSVGRAGLIGQRLSMYAFLLLLAVLGEPVKARAALVGGLVASGIFFGLLFRDLGTASRVEAKIESLVAALPEGTRVVSYYSDLPGSRVTFAHSAYRACIGHCFAFQNYEPATGQFRVRAVPGNTISESNIDVIHGMEFGDYAVRSDDPPLSLIYQCGTGIDDLCVRPMRVGEHAADTPATLPH